MYGYIYKTTNQVNNLIYIGQHKAEKFMGRKYLGSGREIKAAIKEFGRSNFTCELLDTAFDLTELNEKEEYWIEHYHARDPHVGYNVKKAQGAMVNRKNHLLLLGSSYIQVVEQDVEKYTKLGWTEIFHDKAQQNEYDTQLTAKKTLTLSEEERIARRKQKDHERYLANKEEIINRAKKWRIDNNAKYRNWRAENKERLNTRKRDIYNSDPVIRSKQLECSRRYREAHREEIREKQIKRRQQEKNSK